MTPIGAFRGNSRRAIHQAGIAVHQRLPQIDHGLGHRRRRRGIRGERQVGPTADADIVEPDDRNSCPGIGPMAQAALTTASAV